MRKRIQKHFLLPLMLIHALCIYAQSEDPYLISNNQKNFINGLISKQKSSAINLKVDKENSLALNVTVVKDSKQGISLIGRVNNDPLSTFSLTEVNGTLEGSIVLHNSKKAFTLYSETNGKVYAKKVDIHSVLCIDFEKYDANAPFTPSKSAKMSSIPELESLPGATGIIYLDFDGEVVSGTSWLSGATINAASPNYTEEQIIRIWKIMAEDFRPFNLNITTRRDLFEAAPTNRRMMCIFTPTTDAAPGSGGVAYINSFSSSRDNPCWVYNLSIRAAGETGSHEVGHTLGLFHDGKGSTEYYNGHGQWSPIMGWSASRPIGHWSAGEYDGASNPSQDDIAIIANSRNGVGFQNDDHGNDTDNATSIRVSPAGNVSASQNFGLISTRNDKDVFSFAVETGNVTFSFNPDPDYPNLNIQARILNELGQQVAISNPAGLAASISEDLTKGIYYIEIDGVGEGTVNNGYSDYSSLGNYTISGNYIPGDDNNPPLSEFDAIQNCDVIEFQNASTNRINSYLWDFGDGTTSNQENPTHTYTREGTFTVSLTTTNDAGSNTEEKVGFITVRTPVLPSASGQNICSGTSTRITASGNSNFSWYTSPTEGSPIATGATFTTPNLTSNITYYVEGVIGGCKTATRTAVNIIVSESPNQPIATNRQLCNGESATLSVTGNIEYQWFETPTGGSSIATGNSYTTPSLTASKTYYVEGILGDCKTPTRTEIMVTVSDIVSQPEATNQNICSGESATIIVAGNSNFNWYDSPTGGSVLTSGNTFETPTLTDSKTYYIEGVIGNCKTDTRTEVTINVSETPKIPVIRLNQNRSLSISAEFSDYKWYYNNELIEGATQAVYTPTSVGDYFVEVFNESECSATTEKFTVDSSTLNLISQNKAYRYYPNPVTSDDVLNIEGYTIEDYDVRIVNLQGKILFTSTPISQIDVSDLANGLYILLINNKPVGKFIKQ